MSVEWSGDARHGQPLSGDTNCIDGPGPLLGWREPKQATQHDNAPTSPTTTRSHSHLTTLSHDTLLRISVVTLCDNCDNPHRHYPWLRRRRVQTTTRSLHTVHPSHERLFIDLHQSPQPYIALVDACGTAFMSKESDRPLSVSRSSRANCCCQLCADLGRCVPAGFV